MSPRPPIAVLFDLDGTLVDTIPFILAAVRHAFADYGTCPTDAEWIAGIGTPLRAQLEAFARRPADVDHLSRRYRTFWLAHHDELTRCFPDAPEIVADLSGRGHPIGIVTGKLEEGAYRSLRHTGLLSHVRAVVGADSCPFAKPDPAPVRLALERLGRAAEEAIFVGDSPHDITAGRRAGTLTAAALWGACSAQVLAAAGPDHALRQLADLPALVERIEGSW